MNPTLDLIEARCSTRVFDATPITDEEKQAILHATMRAPTAGNLMMYTIVEVEDQGLKERLAVTCDDQPFIAKAPWVLVFVADAQKWIDLFAVSGVSAPSASSGAGEGRPIVPGLGDLMMACSDALIAAQTAVIAAESLGIGSCYIGDILERFETHAELLGLPNHTLPVAMLCFGRPGSAHRTVGRHTDHVVHRDRYRRLSVQELLETSAQLEREFAPSGLKPGVDNYPRSIYQRKFAADYAVEMDRSVALWLERWQTPGPPPAA